MCVCICIGRDKNDVLANWIMAKLVINYQGHTANGNIHTHKFPSVFEVIKIMVFIGKKIFHELLSCISHISNNFAYSS